MKTAPQAVLLPVGPSPDQGSLAEVLALPVIFFLVFHPTSWLIPSHVYHHPRFLIFK